MYHFPNFQGKKKKNRHTGLSLIISLDIYQIFTKPRHLPEHLLKNIG